MSDHKGARLVLDALPPAVTLIADRGYDSTWFREALAAKRHRALHSVEPRAAKSPIAYDKALYRQRHKVENLFAKLKDWRRIATRYDRCAHTFFSAICIAAAVIFRSPCGIRPLPAANRFSWATTSCSKARRRR